MSSLSIYNTRATVVLVLLFTRLILCAVIDRDRDGGRVALGVLPGKAVSAMWRCECSWDFWASRCAVYELRLPLQVASWPGGRKKKKSGTCCGLGGGGGEYLCYNVNMQTAADKAWMVFQIMRMEACDKLHGWYIDLLGWENALGGLKHILYSEGLQYSRCWEATSIVPRLSHVET